MFHYYYSYTTKEVVMCDYTPDENEVVDFDDAEREWCEAFLSDEGSEFSDDTEEDTDDEDAISISEDGYDAGYDGEDDKDGGDAKNLMEEFNFSSTTEDYSAEAALLFSSTQMEKLKEKEKALVERRKKGYYRSKHTHRVAYSKISKAFEPYISRDNLKMLNHEWSTQKNEAMNKSVSAYAPKDRTYCSTPSLSTRVEIAGAVQVAGNHRYWSRVYQKKNLLFDSTLSKHLKSIDDKKTKSNERAATKAGKLRRGRKRLDKLNKAKIDDMKAHKEGLQYEQGVALRKATKNAREESRQRNDGGTDKKEWRCKFFHPLYCTTLGHKSCVSSSCAMHKKDKAERDKAYAFILNELVKENLEKQKYDRKYNIHTYQRTYYKIRDICLTLNLSNQ